MTIRKALGALAVMAALGLVASACSSTKSAVVPAKVPAPSPAVTAVNQAAPKTLAAGSADVTIDLSVSGGVTAALAGGFDFANGTGSLTMHLSGLPPADASLVPSSLPMVFTNGSLYLKAVGAIALADQKKPWAELTPQSLQSVFGIIEPHVNLGTFSTIASGNPADLLKVLDTPDMTAIDQGTQSVNGVEATAYQVTIDAAKAATDSTGPVQALFRALGASSSPLDVWVDTLGRLVQLQTTISPSGASPVHLSVDLTNFGTAVTVPPIPADEVGQLSLPSASTSTSTAGGTGS